MSGLNWQVAPIAFTGGLDSHTTPKLVIPGKWRQLINYTLSEDDALTRRDGISTLVATADGNGLATHNDQLLVYSGPVAKTITATAPAPFAVAVNGLVGNVDISKSEIRRNVGFQATPDCAYGDGFTCYVWSERDSVNAVTGVSLTLIDETTGARIIDGLSLRTNAAVFGVRVVFVHSAFFVFYIQGTSLYCRVIESIAPGTVGAEVALVTSASLATINFDACPFTTATPLAGALVTYGWADGVTSVRAILVGRAGNVPAISSGPTNIRTQAQVAIATIVGLACTSLSATRSGIFVQYITGGNITFDAIVVDDSVAIITGASALDTTATAAAVTACHICAVSDGTRYYVFYDIVAAWPLAALNPLRYVNVSAALAVNAAATLVNGASFAAGAGAARGPKGPFIHGKPFIDSSRIYLPTYVASVYTSTSLATSNPRTNNQQNTFFLFDCGATGTTAAAGAVVAKALYGSYGVASINGVAPPIGTPCSSIQTTATSPSTSNYITVAGELTQLVVTSTAGLNVSPTGLVQLTMSPNFTRGQVRAQLGESTYLSGGSLSAFDGAAIAEHGFPLFPEGIGVTANAGGTGSVTDGVHQICVVAEWVDSSGQRHQSAPSLAVQATLATGANSGSFTVNIPTLLVSQKSGVTFSVYMTQAGGLAFNRVLLNNGAYSPLANITTATNVNFNIDDSDASIAGNELMYTQPNQAGTTLPNLAPGPTDALAVIHNRLWYKKSDQPGAFGYSQEYVNNLGLQFSPDLGGVLPIEAGDLVGIAELDEKVIFLCERKHFVVYGTGPQPSGAFSNYSKPQEIPSDVGCVEARSILEMPRGVMFQGLKGIHLIDRGLNVSFIGEDIQAFSVGIIYAATMMEDREECRFTTRFFNEEGSFLTLVYSYLVDQWSIFFGDGTQSYTIADALYWRTYPTNPTIAGKAPGSYVHVSTSDGLNYDDSNSFVDAPGGLTAATVTTIAQTSWLKVSALEGFQRVRRLYLTGSNSSGNAPASTLTISVNFDDFDSGAPGAYSLNVSTAVISPTALTCIDLRHKLARMKCKSVMFTFTEVPASDVSQPIEGLQAMALEVGSKRGVNRLPSAQTVG